jgi:uncharacterized protein (DUF1330 family)
MMAAYALFDLDMHDSSAMTAYLDCVPTIVHKFGGRYLARGGKTETLEGNWRPNSIVLLEFPNAEKAKAFLNSDEYKPYKELRYRAGASKLILVEGVDREI